MHQSRVVSCLGLRPTANYGRSQRSSDPLAGFYGGGAGKRREGNEGRMMGDGKEKIRDRNLERLNPNNIWVN